MYSVSLVLWELVSRCTLAQDTVPDYQAPYEQEVGQYPTLADMQKLVVQKKSRPQLPDEDRRKEHFVRIEFVFNGISSLENMEFRLNSSIYFSAGIIRTVYND